MAKIIHPKGEEGRLAAQQRAVDQAHQDRADGIIYLDDGVLQRVEDFVYTYREALQRKINARTAQRQAEAAMREAQADLEYVARDVVQKARRSVKRGKAPVALLDALNLPHSGPVLLPTNRAGWLALGAQLHRSLGEISDPALTSMLDVMGMNMAHEAAQAAAEQLYDADTAHQAEQKACQALRPEAGRLCRRVAYELRDALRDETESAARRTMRRYGIRFDIDTQEIVEARLEDSPEVNPEESGNMQNAQTDATEESAGNETPLPNSDTTDAIHHTPAAPMSTAMDQVYTNGEVATD